MKRNSLTWSVLLLVGASTVALAQPSGGNRGMNFERIVDRLDADGDGLLSMEEFREPPRAWSRFDRADSDGDGAVTMAEIETQVALHAEEMLERASQLFEEADLDGDGAVSELERKTAMFDRVDENGDGFISAEELAERRDDRRERRGERRQGR